MRLSEILCVGHSMRRLSAPQTEARETGRRGPGADSPLKSLIRSSGTVHSRRRKSTATRRFKEALIERALGAELSHLLGYKAGAKPELTNNHRNGASGKTVLTDDGPVGIEVPRDRAGTFEPQLIGKHERRFTGFDDKVIALYARGSRCARFRPSSKRCMPSTSPPT